MLVNGLPPESLTRVRVDQGPDSGPGFTLMNYQLADLYDVLATANWQRASRDAPKGKQPKRPPPYPRPEVIREANRRAASRRKKLADLKVRAARRREQIASGAIA